MGKKDNSKAKEKKAEKKAQEAKKHTKIANVKAANAVDDPLAVLPKPFTVYNKNGLNLQLETVRAPELPDETKVAFQSPSRTSPLSGRCGLSTWSRPQ